ncbi:CLUMA_CG005378, isoform A [Clunio marinus]|uniref:CLUMA_CG005378, isoform A n=1 Tax=Clunio marinus TaxID=568069 RepID=A0A1J1HUJ6_9DIPT|nr:CLUMA_CG005378, isoform A [Clunio marinus]
MAAKIPKDIILRSGKRIQAINIRLSNINKTTLQFERNLSVSEFAQLSEASNNFTTRALTCDKQPMLALS